jgi:hypothetical protein
LIGENLTDAKLYFSFGKALLIARRWKGLRVSADLVAGGGSTTHRVFGATCDSGRPCLCVTDSDRDHPEDTIGATARDAVIQGSKRPPFQHVHVLNSRELENVLPFRVLAEALSGPSPSNRAEALDTLGALEASIAGPWRSFIDLKEGLREWDLAVKLAPSGHSRPFWTEFARSAGSITGVPDCSCAASAPCSTREHCCRVYVPAFGSALLQAVEAWVDHTTPHKLAEALGPALTSGELAHITALIVAWCCAYPSQVT